MILKEKNEFSFFAGLLEPALVGPILPRLPLINFESKLVLKLPALTLRGELALDIFGVRADLQSIRGAGVAKF